MFRQVQAIWLAAVLAGNAVAGTQNPGNESRAVRSDPTRPEKWTVSERLATVRLPVLSSVLVGGDRRLAVLDGQVLAEGDRLAGMRLQKVETDRVVLSTLNGALVTVHLDGNQVIKEVR